MPLNSDSDEGPIRETLPSETAAEVDIDVSLLEDSLRLTPWQRLMENERALALVRMLEEAGLRGNGPSKPNPRETQP
jgi:hypothetical protein